MTPVDCYKRSRFEPIRFATAWLVTGTQFVLALALLLVATTTRAITTQEAEDASLNAVTIGSDPALGFSGSGYAVYSNQADASIEWSMTVPTPGSYLLTWTYRDETQPHNLVPSIDGQPLDAVNFPVTDPATTWSRRSIIVDLVAGTHDIRLTGDGIGGPAVDFLTVAPARYRINFSPGTTPAPAGWLRDQGLPFGVQADGLSYGWIEPTGGAPIDVSAGARNRDPSPDIDTFRETLMHMAHPDGTSPWAHWELELPPGDYRVSIQAGDTIPEGTPDTRHRISAEGVIIVDFPIGTGFGVRNGSQIVSVDDGYLTLTSAATDNAKPHLVIVEATGGIQTPLVLGSLPDDGQSDVLRDTTISANSLLLPNPVESGLSGLDNSTITNNSVALYEVTPGGDLQQGVTVNGTGGGDAINITPIEVLDANARYRVVVDGVTDLTGTPVLPFSSEFTTGTSAEVPVGNLDNVAFERAGAVDFGAYTSLVFGPDGRLYGLSLFGDIDRWVVNEDGTLAQKETLSSWYLPYGNVNAIGLAFDPESTAENLVAYVSHVSGGFLGGGGPVWDGKISRISGPDLSSSELLVTNLPRSLRDHLTNSIAVRPGETGVLYFNQGSNSAGGAADGVWGNRPERLLSAANLRLDLTKLPATLPLDAQTSTNQAVIDAADPNSPRLSDGSYNPYYVNAPLTIFATGVRNAYDLLWHSNGQLYIPTNGTAGGSLSPESVAGTRRPDGSFYDGPNVPAVGPNSNQRDWLFRIDPGLPIGYYGHPNPQRGEYVLNRGPIDEPNYPGSVQPDANYRGAAFDFGFNRSPNGVIEYQSGAHEGNLRGALLVTRYSGGSDIIVLLPDGPDGDIGTSKIGIPGLRGFVDPLDIVEDVRNGNLYVSDLATGELVLLRPIGTGDPTPGDDAGVFQQNQFSGLVSIEVENFETTTPRSGHEWTFQVAEPASGSAAMQSTPNIGAIYDGGYETTSPVLEYLVNFKATGRHFVWLRGTAANSNDDSAHVGLDGVGQSGSDRMSGFNDTWKWTKRTMDGSRAVLDVPAIGEHTLNVWMREDGLILDKIVLTTDPKFVPEGFGPAESQRIQPDLIFDPTGLEFEIGGASSEAPPQIVALSSSDGKPATYQLESDVAWLTAEPATGVTPASAIAVSVDPGELEVGTYSGTLTASADGYAQAAIDVTLTIDFVNIQPAISDQVPLETPEDTELEILLSHLLVIDADNVYPDDFVLAVGDGANYTRVGNIVMPDADFNGNLSVPVTVTDNSGEANATSDVFDLVIAVTPVNDQPDILSQSALATAEEQSLSVNLTDLTVFDPDNAYPADFNLTVGDGANYDRVGNTITPTTNFNGDLTVPVSVTDNSGEANAASDVFNLLVAVTAVNDRPQITGQTAVSTAEESPRLITLGDLQVADPDNSYPADFLLTVQDGTGYTRDGNSITPIADFNGDLTVPLVVSDNSGADNASSESFDLLVSVTAVNDAPVITGQQPVSIAEDTSVEITLAMLLVSDPDNEFPLEHTLSVLDGENYTHLGNTITPVGDFFGELSVPVTVTDNSGEATATSDVFMLAVTVSALNDRPVITGQSELVTPEEASLAVTLSSIVVADPDNIYPGDFLLAVQDGVGYSKSGNTITPDADFNGDLSVPVTVTDSSGAGNATSAVYALVVSVTAVNDTPLITGQQAVSAEEDSSVEILLSMLTVTDPDSVYPDDHVLSVLDGANYTRAGNTITPVNDFSGNLTVPVTVADNSGAANATSDVFEMTVTINATNDQPVIAGQIPLVTTSETALEIELAHLLVTDPDNSYPADFTLTVQDGQNYTRLGNVITPVAGFVGILNVPATVTDNSGASNATSDTYSLAVTVEEVAGSLKQDPETGLLSIEVENYDAKTANSGKDWVAIASEEASNGGSMQALPNTNDNFDDDFESISPRLDYLVEFATTGRHYVWLRGRGNSFDNSAHVGLDGIGQDSSDDITGFDERWRWSRRTMQSNRGFVAVDEPGPHVLNLWMREDGFEIDKIVLTPDAKYRPEGFGPDESPR